MRHWFAIFIVPILFLGIFSASTSQLFVHAQSREQLESDLANLEAQIKALTDNINQTQKQGSTLKSEISRLASEIDTRKKLIAAKTKVISQLNVNIRDKNSTIDTLNAKMDREKESLAQIIRKTRYLEQYSLLDFGLQADSLSTFFSDVDSFSAVNKALNDSFKEIRSTRADVEEAKSELEEAKDNETEKKLSLENEKKMVETTQKEKNNLLAITKNQETEYKKVLADREKEAAQIRARLFELRDAASISFGQAYDYANQASRSTGVRPALVLAILMQESALGINVGACYLASLSTGDGVSIRTGDIKPRTMSPTRDVPVFTSLLSRLGRDPLKTQVSCWIAMYSRGVAIGWGGAMGPSQFIPSTWQLFEDRIERVTGRPVADPWNPFDAITATSMYLADLGADAGTESAERNAACKYYSGKSCASSSAGASYGNSVMKKLYSTQQDIDKLNNSQR